MKVEEIKNKLAEIVKTTEDSYDLGRKVLYRVYPNLKYNYSLRGKFGIDSLDYHYYNNLLKVPELPFNSINNTESFKNIITLALNNPDKYFVLDYLGISAVLFEDGYIMYGNDLHFYSNVPEVPDEILKCLVENNQVNKFGYVVKTPSGFTTTVMAIKEIDINLEQQYNDSLPHNNVLNFIKSSCGGISIFHGIPGTGKTTYIRYLISSNPDIKFYFLDSSIFAYIMDPSFISFLLEHKNSVFILEDCEDILISRDNSRNSLISGLLNIADGIIGDSLNIKFICTFNSDLNSIDKALLRKGRLKVKYEFGKLDKNKSQNLINNLGKIYKVTEPMVLCDIYNLEENTGYSEKKQIKIGF